MGTGIFFCAGRAVARAFGVVCSDRRRTIARARVGRLVLLASTATLLPQWVMASQYARLDYNISEGSAIRHTIFFELFDDRPITTANFLQYVNANKYDSSIMHRAISGFVMQGGGFYPQFVYEPQIAALHPTDDIAYSLDHSATVDLDGNSSTTNPTVTNEFNKLPTRLNVRGTIAMAQVPGNANSADNQWFINLADNTNLDVASTSNGVTSGPYTVFGKVAGDGMNYISSLMSDTKFRIWNMNPDANDDGTRETNAFSTTPVYFSNGYVYTVQLVNVDQIDYFGPGLSTTVDGSWSISGRNAVIDTGTVFTGSANLVISQNRSLGIREGYALNRGVINSGTLDPGLQIGKVSVTDYQQYSTGKLLIELAGPTAETQYDRLAVSGTAAVSGNLTVSLINNFSPTPGNSFSFLTAGTVLGTFSTFSLPQLTAGNVWSISKSSTAYTLTVVAADFDHDGVVGAGDYIVWRNTRNTSVTPYTGADADGNGFVNDLDYAIWRANFGNVRGTATAGNGASLAASSVPEPAGVAMLFGGTVFIVARRRRQSFGIAAYA